MCIYRFVISQVFFFCMYSLPTEIKDKTQVKQFGQEAGNFRKLKSHGQYSKKNIQYDTENFFQGSWETHFN